MSEQQPQQQQENNPCCSIHGYNPCVCRHPYLTKEQRINILKYAYKNTKKNGVLWTSPNTRIKVPVGYRAPIQMTHGNGYQNPIRMSGTDGWGATLAPSTMDNLFGSGLSNGINGFSARNGYCRRFNCSGCDKNCPRGNVAPSPNPDPVLGTVITGRYDYRNQIFQKFGNNALYCDNCVKNGYFDASFINHDSFLKAPPLLNQ